MGDRATVQLINSNEADEFSPVAYVHWLGAETFEVIKKAAPLMRASDISYATARLFGALHIATGSEQALSYGVSNATSIQTEDECGDAGHFQIDIATGEVRHWGWPVDRSDDEGEDEGRVIATLELYKE